jgi:hypothetical protein
MLHPPRRDDPRRDGCGMPIFLCPVESICGETGLAVGLAAKFRDGGLQETFTQSSVPRVSENLTETKALAGSRTN